MYLLTHTLETEPTTDWNEISRSTCLSPDFLFQNKERLDWNLVSKHNRMSEKIIREFKFYLNFNLFLENPNVSCKTYIKNTIRVRSFYS